ncbi:MAG: Flp family type IVb pilin [Gammaproteobacteria bacterium]
MKAAILNFLRDEEGASAIEYALIAGIISVGILLSLEGVRDAINTLFGKIKDALTDAGAAADG